MTFNRIAVYGHRGWASSAIVDALAKSGAPIRVMHQPSSDASGLPTNVSACSVDVADEKAVIRALDDIDIVICLVGHEGIARQHGLINAIPRTKVKLFVPSDMAHRTDQQALAVPALKLKREVEEATKKAGIPMTLVWPGYLVESSIRTPLLGVDYVGNRLIYSGGSKDLPVPLCTLQYVAAAYASIFASTPIPNLAGRTIGITELSPTGGDIARALEEKYGKAPEVFHHSLTKIDHEMSLCAQKGIPLTAIWYYRRAWGAGSLPELVGQDIWTVPGYTKKTLHELVVEDKMAAYRDLPPPVVAGLLATFN